MDLGALPSPANLLGSILFGLVGMAAFVYGKKRMAWKPMALGALLMVYPYAVPQTWLIYLIGCALCAALYIFRD